MYICIYVYMYICIYVYIYAGAEGAPWSSDARILVVFEGVVVLAGRWFSFKLATGGEMLPAAHLRFEARCSLRLI